MLLQTRYEDGAAMSHSDIGDELLTLLVAGYETTSVTLSWAIERVRRHPELLARLTAEADEGGSELRKATIIETQRLKPVVGMTRRVRADSLTLGDWVIPNGHTVIASNVLIHENESIYSDALAFNPDRFVGAKPDSYAWIPFGGGTRRCIGAAFAGLEMDVVLRTLLREFAIIPTNAPAERESARGVALTPKGGGAIRVQRRG